jgi:hypothetical protein
MVAMNIHFTILAMATHALFSSNLHQQAFDAAVCLATVFS